MARPTTFENALDVQSRNKEIQSSILNSIKNQFPIKGNKRILELKEISVEDSLGDFDFPSQKEAKLKGQSWGTPIVANLQLKDKDTGVVVDETKVKVGTIPKMTSRFSTIIDGSEYQTQNQFRLKSGIYTRKKENGQLESRFNLEKGYNFTLDLDPEKGVFYLTLANKHHELYALLKGLGTPDSDMQKAWGEKIFLANQRAGLGKEAKVITDIYNKITNQKVDFNKALPGLKQYLDETKVSPETTKLTLGKSFERVNESTILASSQKLLKVMRGEEKSDERDSLVFKELYGTDDLLSTYFDKNADKIVNTLAVRADLKNKIKDFINSETYGKPIKDFFTTGDLSATSPQTNPVEMLDDWRKTTVMGAGGIKSRHAITDEARDLHPSHIGFLDPIATPDCTGPDHEIFTKTGWKYIDSVSDEEEIACLIKGRLEFHKPCGFTREYYSGKMYEGVTARFSYFVTPNHRMYVKPDDHVPKNYFPDYKIETAEKMFGKTRKFKINHLSYKGKDKKTFKLTNSQQEFNINDWSSFMGWYLSEGHTAHYGYGTYYPQIGQCPKANPKNFEKILALLEKMGLRYYVSGTNIVITNKELGAYTKNFGLSYDKYIPEEYFDFPRLARKKLLWSLLQGDGKLCKNHESNQIVFTSGSSRLASDFERLAIGLGYGVTHKIYPDNRKERYVDIHEVRILQNKNIQISGRGGQQKIVDYKGMVYCPMVPGGLFLTRRGGGASYWTGNSFKVGITLPLSIGVNKINKNIYTPLLKKGLKVDPKNLAKFSEDFTPAEMWDLKIGFPDQYKIVDGVIKASYNKVKGYYKGKPAEFDANEVDYFIVSPAFLFSFTSNLIPFLPNTQGNRAGMGARMLTQAVSLENREVPMVQVANDFGSTYEELASKFLQPTPEKPGVVDKIDEDYIHVTHDDGTKEKIGLYNNFPLNQNSYLHSDVKVKVGDRFKAGQPLSDHTFSKDGVLALGANARVAYMPWKGYNFEDGVVITESAANKFTSQALTKKNIRLTKNGVQSKAKFRTYFPDKVTLDNYKKLGDDGVIREGEQILPGEALVLYMEPREQTQMERLLKKMNKVSHIPFSDKSLIWENSHSGVVQYVRKIGKTINIFIKVKHPMQIGDKLCVDEKTEFLTEVGWKKLLDLSIKDKIFTLNSETDQIKLETPHQINIYDHNGPMYRIKNSSIDQLVTLNHKMYVKPRNKNTYSLIPAESIKGKRVRYKKDGIWYGNTDIVPNELKNIFKTDLQYSKFMGWYIAEGSAIYADRGNYIVQIAQSWEANQEKCEQIAKLLDSCDIHWVKTQNGFRIYNKALYTYLKPLGKAQEKYIPKNIKIATPEIINAFLETYRLGDGYLTKTKQQVFITTSVKLRDDLQEVILKAGFSANFKKHNSVGDLGGIRNGARIVSKNDSWAIRVYFNKNNPQVKHGHVFRQHAQEEEIIDYVGKVGCPTTSNGIVYIRRNGKTCWTGNSGRYGNKGIVTKVIPDHETPHDKNGRPVEVIMSPAGVPGRINPSQLLETAAGKWAEKTGKPYIVKNFSDSKALEDIQEKLKKENIEVEETLFDGKDGKPFENKIFVGNQYTLRLMHDVDKKIKARERGNYDQNMQPGAGKTGGQSIDPMLMYSLVAHGAKQNLRDATLIKGQQNDDFWRALQLGQPLPTPKTNFAWDKMLAHLQNSGVNIEKKGNEFITGPFTDKHLDKITSGALKDAGKMLVGKNLTPEKEGLFDPDKVGGMDGSKWSHINLNVKMPHPFFEGAIQKILGISSPTYTKIMNEEHEEDGLTGTALIEHKLKNLNIDREIKSTKEELASAPKSRINVLNKKMRHLNALKTTETSPEDLMISKFPVMPAKFRPVYPLPSGDLRSSPINDHYRNIALIANSIKTNKEIDLEEIDNRNNRKAMYRSLKEALGITEPLYAQMKSKPGLIKTLAGPSPKEGFIQNTVWGKRQDVSARSTITVAPDLGLDEAGIPKDIAKKIFGPFAVKEMVSYMGLSPIRAKEELKKESTVAMTALKNAMDKRPVLLNRAPSLHKHSVQAFKPLLVDGKDIRTNPLIVSGFNADFDGDTMSVHVPVSAESVDEAYGMLPSKNIFKGGDHSLVHEISKDYQLGLYFLTKPGKDTKKRFKSVSDAQASGLGLTDVFNLDGKRRTTIGIEMVNALLPIKHRDYNTPFNSKKVESILEDIGKNSPQDFSKVITGLKDLGNQYGHQRGTTVSINDLVYDKKLKEDILKKWDSSLGKNPSDQKIVDTYQKAKKDIADTYIKQYTGKNKFYDWIESGGLSKSKSDGINQMIGIPGILTNTKGQPIPIPIKTGYADGLNTHDYFTTIYGVRKGTVDRAVNTQESGALNKRLLGSTRYLIIKEEDCETKEGIDFPKDDKNLLDRVLLKDVPTIAKAGEVVTPEIYRKIKNSGHNRIWVRSPLTCETDRGVCQQCYGLAPGGQFPSIGTNVGVLDGQAVTERSTQLTMRCSSAFNLINYKLDNVEGYTTHQELWSKLLGEVFEQGGIETKVLSQNLEILKREGWVKVEKVQRHKPEASMIIIRTKDGNALITQKDHPLRIYNDVDSCDCRNPKIKRIQNNTTRCDTCKREKLAAIPDNERDVNSILDVELKKDGFYVDYSNFLNKNKEIPDPIFSGYTTGVYTGDGNIQKTENKYWGLMISSHVDSAHKKIIGMLKEDGLTPNEKIKNVIKVYDVDSAKEMEKLVSSYAKTKKLNTEFYKYSKEWLDGFLSGLIDTDGCVVNKNHNSYIKIYSSSWALMQQVFIMSKILDFKCRLNIAKISDESGTVGAVSTTQPYYAEIRLKPGVPLFKDSVQVKQKYKRNSKIFNNFVFTQGIDKIVSYRELEIYDDYTYDFKVQGSVYSINGIDYHNTFHSGGAAGTGGGVTAGFNRLEQIFKVPQQIDNKAILAKKSGRVDEISPHFTGGYEIIISGESHIIPTDRVPVVKRGDFVSKGDRLSKGNIKPQELAELKSFKDAQLALRDELDEIYEGGFHKKTFETVLRGVSDNGEVIDPGDTEFVRGDKIRASHLKKINKSLKEQGKTPIKFKEYFKSIDMGPDTDDWLDMLSNVHLKQTIQDMASTRMASNIHGTNPLPGYMYGVEFADKKKKGFY
jgi:DNA-directed RNA polymerase beta subunit/DNA-directed RNA polymerase beta' subunit